MLIREKIIYLFFWLLRVGLGVFFLIVGSMKAMKLDELTADIQHFDIVPAGCEWYMACLGVAMELAIGICFVFKRLYLAAAVAGCALTACFVAIFVQAWIRGLVLSCSCLGVAREATNYPFEVGWRLLLFLAMVLVFFNARKKDSPFSRPARLDFSDI